MNLTSKEIIKNLNDRLFTQSIVVETLCDLLVETGVSHDDLEDMIKENVELTRKSSKNLQIKQQITINIEKINK